MSFLYISIGAILGAISRYLLQTGFASVYPSFPYGTLIANLVGSFIIGLIFPFLSDFSPGIKLLVVTGYLGALTTLSGYAFEVVNLLQQKRYLYASAHWVGGAFICIGFCAVGLWLGQLFVKSS